MGWRVDGWMGGLVSGLVGELEVEWSIGEDKPWEGEGAGKQSYHIARFETPHLSPCTEHVQIRGVGREVGINEINESVLLFCLLAFFLS